MSTVDNRIIVPEVRREPISTDPMLAMIERAARDPAVDIDKLERLFALQREMLAEQKKTAYNAAMSRVQAQLKPVFRDAMNNQTNSPYARLESISDAITPIITAEGFSLSFDTAESPKADHIRIVCSVMHSAGHSEPKHLDLALDNVGLKGNANKTPVQGTGSTISYGRRYLKCMVFDVVLTNEDNDGQYQDPAPRHETKGDSLNVVPVDVARAKAVEMIAVMDLDVEENVKALKVYDLHDALCKDNDLYIAASHQMDSKMRGAWKKYVTEAKRMEKESGDAPSRFGF
jgi:hypothetical protein